MTVTTLSLVLVSISVISMNSIKITVGVKKILALPLLSIYVRILAVVVD